MSHYPPFAAALLLATAVLPAWAGDVDKVMELAKPAIVRIEVLMAEGQDGRMVKQRGFGSGSRGFGFVEMSSDSEAQAAITALNGAEMGGRTW